LARVEETQQSQRDEIAAAMSEMRQMLVMSKAQSNTQRVSLQVPQTPSSVEDASLKDEVVALRNITSTFPGNIWICVNSLSNFSHLNFFCIHRNFARHSSSSDQCIGKANVD
jgi:hypothetical protein